MSDLSSLRSRGWKPARCNCYLMQRVQKNKLKWTAQARYAHKNRQSRSLVNSGGAEGVRQALSQRLASEKSGWPTAGVWIPWQSVRELRRVQMVRSCVRSVCGWKCFALGGKMVLGSAWSLKLRGSGLDLEGLFRCDRRFFLLQLPTSSPIHSQQPSFSLHQVHTMH